MKFDRISRKEEYKLPSFKSHAEAREYFKNIYGHNFQMIDSQEYSDCKIYFYRLILDMEQYMSCIRELQETNVLVDDGTDTCLAFRFITSYQSVEIYEDGRIHIVH